MPKAETVLRKPDLLEELADCLRREQFHLEHAQIEHTRVMEIYRRLSPEAAQIATEVWPV